MRSSSSLRIAAAIFSLSALISASSCSKSGSTQATGGFPAGSGSVTPACNAGASFTQPTFSPANAMTVTVDGSLCGGSGAEYPNEICASVTICTPGCDNQCQTISDVLLDTGSYGLRLFSSAITIPLTQVANGPAAVAECVGFGDSSSEWGPVELADVMLAGEPVVKNVPILVINSGYNSSPPEGCDSNHSIPDTGPSEAGFNGILGVGLFAQDCGPDCTTDSGNGQYFTCQNGEGCGGSTVTPAQMVTNPVALMATDNNGVILKLPTVADEGTPSVNNGTVVFGIDTSSNNSTYGMKYFAADGDGNFKTTFNSATMDAFIDSGSSDLEFTAPSGTADCSGHDQSQFFGGNGDEFYCPSPPPLVLSATQTGVAGSQSNAFSFNLENAFDLLFGYNGGGNFVFSTIGGPSCVPQPGLSCPTNGFFDWGLPFFFGRPIAVGIENTSSNLGTGPSWSY